MDQIINNIWLAQNFKCVKNIKKCNPTVKFLKYVAMLIFVVGSCTICYNQVCS